MKIVFMGTPDFAAAALEAIIKAGHEVTAAVTQPDKPKGRSGQMQFSPVKECAIKYGVPVLQPERIKKPEAVAQLREYESVLGEPGDRCSQIVLHTALLLPPRVPAPPA